MHRTGSPIYTKSELEEQAAIRHGSWGDLWVCPLCLGTWISALVATILTLIWPELPALGFIASSALTWPVLFYLLYGILKRI